MVDNYRHKGLRNKLIVELRSKGISDEKVLNVMANLPRHYFLDKAFDSWAYKDIAFPIDAEQTISQPYTVAFQTSLLELKRGDKVLEIGTGSGYQAAVLVGMGVKVYTIERQISLYEKTSQLLVDMGLSKIRTLYGDGFKGAERFAPFDSILITAGANTLPALLFQQLKIGGKLVIPIGDRKVQKMERYTKLSNGKFKKENFGDFSFVPMLHGVTVE